MLYKNFRLTYPQASLITELVQIENGRYIVRCVIQENKVTLSCGLAADKSIEISENRAIERALTLLTLDDNSEVSSNFIKKMPELYIEVPRQKNSEVFIAPPEPKEETIENNSQKLQTEDEIISEIAMAVPDEEETVTEVTIDPIDFSEVISKTNRELKRIEWTTQQGKEYLMKTYGKRSRQLLSDEELLDFLKFLESQSPSSENIF